MTDPREGRVRDDAARALEAVGVERVDVLPGCVLEILRSRRPICFVWQSP